MSLDDFITNVLSKTQIDKVKHAKEWPQVESLLGRLYFGVSNYFASPEYDLLPTDPNPTIQSQDTIPLPKDDRPAGTDLVRYLAVNHRGFYLRNGRETLLAPYQKLKEVQPNLQAHYDLHKAYLHHLSQKSESINQVFLASSDLGAIEVHFEDVEESTLSLRERKYLEVVVGKDVSSLWEDALFQSRALANDYLRQMNPKLLSSLPPLLSKAREIVLLNVERQASTLLATSLFSSWSRELSGHYASNLVGLVEQFRNWVLAVGWLAFYCYDGHAGRHFYSVRLPRIVQDPVGRNDLPESSISIVSSERLEQSLNNSLRNLRMSLLQHNGFKQIQKEAGNKWKKFYEARAHNVEEGWKKDISVFLTHRGETERQYLPIDFDRTIFLLKMSRDLVGKKHEGMPLHFCFILGFSSERIDSETRGCLREEISGLRFQWKRFLEKVVSSAIHTRYPGSTLASLLSAESDSAVLPFIADGMSKWIKNGDLSLSPWDMALFFEEAQGIPWPVPTSIVRVLSTGSMRNETIATEFQLRRALRDLTQTNPSMLAVLIVQTGLILFGHGRSLLIPCSGKEKYDDNFPDIRLKGDEVDRELFADFLSEKLEMESFENVLASVKRTVCWAVVDICEALVSLGHGSLIIIRAKSNISPVVPPLNPMWQVLPNVNSPEFDKGIFLYALLAALDGATEIVLPEGDEPISFSVKKNALPQKMIWGYDGDGDATVTEEFKEIADMLGLIGKGTRHHSALALSLDLKEKAIVITVSADGPVTLWINGRKAKFDKIKEYEPKLKP